MQTPIYINEIYSSDSSEKNYFPAVYNNLGVTLSYLKHHYEAIKYYSELLRKQKERLAPKHYDIAITHINIAKNYDSIGRIQKTLEHSLDALKILEAILPKNHNDIAAIHIEIGKIYYNFKQHQEAYEHFFKAKEIWEKILPKNHPDLAKIYNNLGQVFFDTELYQEAYGYFLNVLEIYQVIQQGNSNPDDMFRIINNIGMTYYNRSKYQEAIEFFLEALKWSISSRHYDITMTYTNLGISHKKLIQHQESITHFLKALEHLKEVSHSQDTETMSIIINNNLATNYLKLEVYDKAIKYFSEAIKIWEKTPLDTWNETFLSNTFYIVAVYINAASCYINIEEHSKNHWENAITYLSKVINILSSEPDSLNKDLSVALTYKYLGKSWQGLGYNTYALEHFLAAIDLHKSVLKQHPDSDIVITHNTIGTINNIAQIYYKSNKLMDAIKYFKCSYILCNEIDCTNFELDNFEQMIKELDSSFDDFSSLNLKSEHNCLVGELYEENTDAISI